MFEEKFVYFFINFIVNVFYLLLWFYKINNIFISYILKKDMFERTKIEKRVEIEGFIKFVREYKLKQIECTNHIFFRLSEKQRKIYNCDELRRILTQEIPFLVGFQYNKNYAVFYKHKNKNLKMILNMDNRKVKIVTFYFIEEWQIPKI